MFPENETIAIGTFWDGIYTGQSELLWSYSSWISDPDGVDTVFFQYRYSTGGEWMNRTPTLQEGNSTNGRYSYIFTQSISWDWETSWPQVEGGLYVEFRIFANDSLGNWRTTQASFRSGGWMMISTPPTSFNIPLEIWWVIGAAVVAIIAVWVIVYRRSSGTTVQ